jgi:THO complex subunit 2
MLGASRLRLVQLLGESAKKSNFVLPANIPARPAFYLTFWQLSTYDISPPDVRYAEETATLRTLSRQEESKYNAAERSSQRGMRSVAAAHKAKRDRYNMFVTQLNEEFKEQITSRAFTVKRLAREKQYWFSGSEFICPWE